MNYEETVIATNIVLHECFILFQSTKIGTHENEGIPSNYGPYTSSIGSGHQGVRYVTEITVYVVMVHMYLVCDVRSLNMRKTDGCTLR